MSKLCHLDSCDSNAKVGFKGFCEECFTAFTLVLTKISCKICGRKRRLAKEVCECGGT